jgi:hypothetical protein
MKLKAKKRWSVFTNTERNSFHFGNGGSLNTSRSDFVCEWNVRFFGRLGFSWHSCGMWQRVLTYLNIEVLRYFPNVGHYLPNYTPSRTRRHWIRGSITARVIRHFLFRFYIEPVFAARPSYAPVAKWIKRSELKVRIYFFSPTAPSYLTTFSITKIM